MASQPRIEQQRRRQAWLEWIDQHRPELKSIGLPPEVYIDLDHWEDFLEDGDVDRHPEASMGFSFWDLSPAQMHRLLVFLETHTEFVPDYARLPGFLRFHLEYE